MYFIECARLAEQHPDLATVFERLDSQFRELGKVEVLRPEVWASYLNVDPNQMRSALDMLAEHGVLRREEMIECPYCEMVALRSDYLAELEEEEEYRCTSCDRPLKEKSIQVITAYRRGEKWQEASNPSDGSGDTGIGVAPQTVPKVTRMMGSAAAVEALLALKSKKGWTMVELARAVGTTARTLQKLFKLREIRSSTFRTMAERLGISAEDLLAGKLLNAPK